MKKKRQHLTLKTETLRLLSDDTLRAIHGGGGDRTWCASSEMNETCSDVFTKTVACPER